MCTLGNFSPREACPTHARLSPILEMGWVWRGKSCACIFPRGEIGSASTRWRANICHIYKSLPPRVVIACPTLSQTFYLSCGASIETETDQESRSNS
jgi:hypothetical protein